MPRKTKSSPRPAPQAAPETLAQRAAEVLKGAPKAAETRVRSLIESSRPALDRAQAFAQETGQTLTSRSKVIRKNLARSAKDLGVRVDKERKALGRRVDSAVKTTLASLNIPTRSEINLLTRRVEELSRKIDGMKRR